MPRGIYKRTPEMKTGKHMLGRKLSEEARKKISEAGKGNKYNLGKKQLAETIRKRFLWRKGYKHSDKTREKIGIANSKWSHPKGKDHYNWQGGKAVEAYTLDWTKTLKISIRERDHYTCKICGEKQGDRAFCVHHIDYNKENCNPNNLITLCLNCHMKTNFNRENWLNYFKYKYVSRN